MESIKEQIDELRTLLTYILDEEDNMDEYLEDALKLVDDLEEMIDENDALRFEAALRKKMH